MVIPENFNGEFKSDPEGITGEELIEFIDSNVQNNKGLFATLRTLSSINNPKRAAIVKEVFDGSNNYMKSGYEMRKVINKLNEIDLPVPKISTSLVIFMKVFYKNCVMQEPRVNTIHQEQLHN